MMSETKVTKKPPLLRGKTREAFFTELKNLLTKKASAAYVFGSLASNEFHADSDLDLIIVTDSIDKPFIERPLAFPELLSLPMEVDVLVYTSEEFSKLEKESKVGFWKTAFKQMIKIL